MLNKIQKILPTHTVIGEKSPELFIVDYKNINGGSVILHKTKPMVDHVFIDNKKNEVPIFFDGFDDNALKISTGFYSKQCECVLFPQDNTTDYWILFVETKYVNNIKSAFDENHDYPNCMVNQIIETVDFFRNNGILDHNKTVNAIVSFPTLINDFSSTFFTGSLSIEDIFINHKIKIRAKNTCKIISSKRIKI